MRDENRRRRWRVLGSVVAFILACAAVLAVTAPLAPRRPGLWQQALIGTLASLGAFALTVLFARRDQLRLDDVGAAPGSRSLLRFAVGFGIGLFLFALSKSILAAAVHLRWVRAPRVGPAAAVVALIAYLALACREELAFRGYPLRRLERPFGLWGAQLMVALAFAIEHRVGGWPWEQAIAGAGAGSLLFGMAAIATRGLAMPIGLHAAWNFGDWALGGKDTPGLWQAVVDAGHEGNAQRAGTLSYLAVVGASTLALWWFHRRRNNMDLDSKKC
jgi:membrane protease YdiL (CAAX protease family)